MTRNEYDHFYMDFVVSILDPSVEREANIDHELGRYQELQRQYQNYLYGLEVLALIAFIEENFVRATPRAMKALRNFKTITSIPKTINQKHFSCFVYLRDCFGHNPSGLLIGQPSDNNRSGFTSAVASGDFPWVTLAGAVITIAPEAVHQLHLIVLRFFGENV